MASHGHDYNCFSAADAAAIIGCVIGVLGLSSFEHERFDVGVVLVSRPQRRARGSSARLKALDENSNIEYMYSTCTLQGERGML